MRTFDLGPSLFGRRTDLWAFGGSAAVALGLAAVAALAGVRGLGDFSWLLLVLAVDVAHVHATWFRTYLDRDELARHPLRYWVVPLVLYGLGVAAFQASSLVFWRVLAYAAAFHFVRQQVGWVALYRARAGIRNSWERWIDEAAIYAATLYPLFYFHVQRDALHFSWFVPGDFVRLDLAAWLPFAQAAWALALGAFLGRELLRALRERRFAAGKALVIVSTALTWYVGIIACNSDFVFTATNVIPHGVPYAVLLFAYTRERAARAPSWSVGQVVAGGFAAFVLLLIACAFVEQLLWDRLVDHDRSWIFGEGPELASAWLAWIVPLLALPQATHYVLDGLLWRRSEAQARPALRAAIGAHSAQPAVTTVLDPAPVAQNGGNA